MLEALFFFFNLPLPIATYTTGGLLQPATTTTMAWNGCPGHPLPILCLPITLSNLSLSHVTISLLELSLSLHLVITPNRLSCTPLFLLCRVSHWQPLFLTFSSHSQSFSHTLSSSYLSPFHLAIAQDHWLLWTPPRFWPITRNQPWPLSATILGSIVQASISLQLCPSSFSSTLCFSVLCLPFLSIFSYLYFSSLFSVSSFQPQKLSCVLQLGPCCFLYK